MDKQSRNLPEVNIGGATFFADALRGVLVDKDNKDNLIYTGDMLRLDDHFEFVFDKHNRCLTNSNDGLEHDQFAYIWLRPLEVYDVEGAKMRLDNEEVSIPRNLPIIKIEGTAFLWDKCRTRLLQKDNPYNQIHKCSLDIHQGELGIYFDKRQKVVVFPQERKRFEQNGGLPEHIRFIPSAIINRKIRQAERFERQTQSTLKNKRIRVS